MKNLPDKIYLDIRGFENVDMSFSEVRQRFGVPYYEHSMSNNDVEYIRKDAFIEKACEWLSNVSIEDMAYKYNDFDTSEDWYKFIEDFKKYMSL